MADDALTGMENLIPLALTAGIVSKFFQPMFPQQQQQQQQQAQPRKKTKSVYSRNYSGSFGNFSNLGF